MTQQGMSLRKIAKELGVSHTLLSLWRQGKRNLSPELEEHYYEVVTNGYTRRLLERSPDETTQPTNGGMKDSRGMVGHPGIEPGTSVLSGLRSNRLS